MMLVFWLLVAGMLALALLFFLPVLLRGSGEILDSTEQENLELARERLQDLEQAKKVGEISEADFALARQELEELLAADIAVQPSATRMTKQGRSLIGGLLVVVPVVSIVLYQYLGNPELIQTDRASVNQGMSADPSATSGNGQQLPSVDVMLARLAERLQQQPNDPEGWYMLARSYTVMQRFEEAMAAYERLQQLVGEDPEITAEIAQLQQRIAREANVKVAEALPGIVAAKITVMVSLSDAVKDQVTADDTVYILARATDGPPMPLAVVKKQVKDLPIRVVLDDSQAMMPELKLSRFDEVSIVARVSKSGSPMGQSGDIEGQASPVKPMDQPSVKVIINQRIP